MEIKKMNDSNINKNNCLACGCEIDLYFSSVNKKNGKRYYNKKLKKYCSCKCSRSCQIINKDPNKPIVKRVFRIIKCIICNKDTTGQKYCKSCADKTIKEKGIERSRIRNKNISIVMKLIRNILIHMSGGCCRMCGNKTKNSLAFHHINPKDKLFSLDVSTIKRKSIELILEESYKCMLLCHNCHSDLHQAERDKNVSDGYKYYKNKYITRKLKYIEEKGGKCSSCDRIFHINNIQSASFHHNRDKIFDLCSDALIRRSDTELDKEVKKCTLLCRNCHMELHHSIE